MNAFTMALPSVMTLGSLFCGLLSAVYTLEGSFVAASWLIIAAALFDALDGKVSRIFRAQSRFGVELDSIADVCSFGFAPALLGYHYTLVHLPGWGPLAFPFAFTFLACGALRLARFNVQLRGYNKSSFKGMPIPVAAGILAAFIVFMNSDLMAEVPLEWLFPVLQLVTAALMVSTFTYSTFPRLGWHTRASRVKLMFALGGLVVAVLHPAEVFFPIGLAYLVSGPLRAGVHLVRRTPSEEMMLEASDGEEALI